VTASSRIFSYKVRVAKEWRLHHAKRLNLSRQSDFACVPGYFLRGVTKMFSIGFILFRTLALIVVSAVQSSGQENVRQENRRFAIFLSYIFLSAGLHGRNDDQGSNFEVGTI
jgi:hypothetical protein